MIDGHDFRQESRRRWGRSAPGWKTRPDAMRAADMVVAERMVDAIAPRPGHTVLELAAGAGDVGFLAAERIRPAGTLICSDFAPEMLSAAQERAAELGLDNVRYKQIDAESIDLPAASVDGVVCRWGYMLMLDPLAALRETRRVLKPGGRLALAAWASPDENLWSAVWGRELERRNLLPPVAPGEPGQFAWQDPATIEEALLDAGFVEDISVEPVDFEYPYGSFEDWWKTALAISSRLRDAVDLLAPGDVEDLRATVRAELDAFVRDGGALVIPARCWVAAATA